MKMLVTGATGKLGSKIVEKLLETVPADQLAVSVRNPEKAEALRARGVDVRHGDFDRPETLESAFRGIDRLLIISADGDNGANPSARQCGSCRRARRSSVYRLYEHCECPRKQKLPCADSQSN